MGDLFLLSERQMARISPFFPLAHGVPRVDDRRVVLPVSFSDAAPAQARDDLKGKGEKRKGSENAAVDR